MKNPNNAAILGALVADSAALGLHWLYDPARIAEIEAASGLAFLKPDAGNYAGAKGYFAHGGKTSGESTGYGEVCLLALRHLAKHGTFNRVAPEFTRSPSESETGKAPADSPPSTVDSAAPTPAWAARLQQRQSAVHGATTAAHVLRGSDHGGSGTAPRLHQDED